MKPMLIKILGFPYFGFFRFSEFLKSNFGFWLNYIDSKHDAVFLTSLYQLINIVTLHIIFSGHRLNRQDFVPVVLLSLILLCAINYVVFILS